MSTSFSSVRESPKISPTPSSPKTARVSSTARAAGTVAIAGASRIVIAKTNPALMRGAIAGEEKTGQNTISPLSRTITSTAAVRYCGQSSINPLSSRFISSLSQVLVKAGKQMQREIHQPVHHPRQHRHRHDKHHHEPRHCS